MTADEIAAAAVNQNAPGHRPPTPAEAAFDRTVLATVMQEAPPEMHFASAIWGAAAALLVAREVGYPAPRS